MVLRRTPRAAAGRLGAAALILLAAAQPAGAAPPPAPAGASPFLLGGVQVNEADHERWAAALLRAGMNAVEVTAYAHQGAWNGDELWFAEEEPSVLAEIRAARRNGLQVVLLLRVALDHNYPENRFLWHGLIHPQSEAQLAEWFRRYTAFVVEWARVAQAEGVQVLGIGSEMNSLAATLPVEEVPELAAYYLDEDKQLELRALVDRHRHLFEEGDLAAMGAGDFTSLEEFLVQRNRAERWWARLYTFAGEEDRLARINRRRRLLLAHWQRLIAEVRGVYRGRLTFAANFDNYREVAFWDRLDLIGINAYFPLRAALGSPLTEGALQEAWREVFAEIETFKSAHDLDRPVFFTELGYTRRSGVTVAPWSSRGFVPIWSPQGDHVLLWSARPIDPEERALAVRALYAAWSEERWPFAGLLYWKLSSRLELERYEPFMLYLGAERGDPLFAALRLFAGRARPLVPVPRDAGDAYARWAGAITRADLAAVERLGEELRQAELPRGAEPLLHLAVRLGRGAIVRRLLERGADPGARDRFGHLALHWSCYQDDPDLVAPLLPDAAVSWDDDRGETPFHKCARLDNAAVLRQLLRHRRDLAGRPNRLSRTALWLAADQASVETVALLAGDAGAVEQIDDRGATPLHVAAARGDPEVVELLRRTSDPETRDRYGNRAVHHAAYHGHAEAFRLLWRPATARRTDASDQTLLHHAAHGGAVEIVEILLEHGFEVDRPDRDGRTPLHHAVMKSHAAATRLLLERGADARRADAAGRTPVHVSAEIESTELLELLLARPVDLDRADARGDTPLHLAAAWGRVDNTRLLLAAGASTDLRNLQGRTALGTAEALGRKRVAEMLRRPRPRGAAAAPPG